MHKGSCLPAAALFFFFGGGGSGYAKVQFFNKKECCLWRLPVGLEGLGAHGEVASLRGPVTQNSLMEHLEYFTKY